MSNSKNPEWLTLSKEHILLSIHVSAAAKATKVAGCHDGRVKVRVAAQPESGKANKELCEFIATIFSCPLRDVSVVKGVASRRKTLQVVGQSKESIIAAMHALL